MFKVVGSGIAALLVFGATYVWTQDIALALILAGVAPATAPAAIFETVSDLAPRGVLFGRSVRDAFDWRTWLVPVAGLVVGMPLGIYVFSQFNKAQMRVAIGAVLVVAVVVVGATFFAFSPIDRLMPGTS